jgi:hypothetical protein
MPALKDWEGWEVFKGKKKELKSDEEKFVAPPPPHTPPRNEFPGIGIIP